jgi:hypothetical protein
VVHNVGPVVFLTNKNKDMVLVRLFLINKKRDQVQELWFMVLVRRFQTNWDKD